MFSPDGKSIASGSYDGSVKCWDTKKGSELKTFDGNSGMVFSVVYSPDGKTIASGNQDGTINLWDAQLIGQQR